MGSTCCGKCRLFKENKKQEKNEYGGLCKKFKIKRSYETSSCDSIKLISPNVERDKETVGGDMFE